MRHSGITVIVLTYNEAMHIERCISSVSGVADEVWVVDSFSTDTTCEIAERLGARTVKHKFENQAQQFNWAIDTLEIAGEWIWRIDADEYIEPPLGELVKKAIETCDEDVNGIYVNKKIVFLGKPLKHGGWYPAPQIKVIRRGHGRSENKAMDEHLIITDGRTIAVDGDQTDENLNDLTWWTDKHNRYSDREALNMLRMEYGLDEDAKRGVTARLFGNDAERKRWLKLRYARMPLYVRPFLNFAARYLLKGGFLDGNIRWYILQCFWYRFLVDSKIYEIKKRLGFDEEKIISYLKGDSILPPPRLLRVVNIQRSFVERRAYAA